MWIGTSGINRSPRIGGTGLAMHWNGRRWRELQGVVGTPIIDEPLGVWFSQFYYLTPKGTVFVRSPTSLDGWWSDVTQVPGSTDMLTVGDETTGKDKGAFIGGFGRLP